MLHDSGARTDAEGRRDALPALHVEPSSPHWPPGTRLGGDTGQQDQVLSGIVPEPPEATPTGLVGATWAGLPTREGPGLAGRHRHGAWPRAHACVRAHVCVCAHATLSFLLRSVSHRELTAPSSRSGSPLPLLRPSPVPPSPVQTCSVPAAVTRLSAKGHAQLSEPHFRPLSKARDSGRVRPHARVPKQATQGHRWPHPMDVLGCGVAVAEPSPGSPSRSQLCAVGFASNACGAGDAAGPVLARLAPGAHALLHRRPRLLPAPSGRPLAGRRGGVLSPFTFELQG